MNRIEKFSGRYDFLSNFFPSEVRLDGEVYPTIEHAFQAAKTFDKSERAKIQRASSPGDAKRLGRRVQLRKDWEFIKLSVMEELLRQKFEIPFLKSLLSETGDAELVEGNNWGDSYWGVCGNIGENHLGRLLMKIRSQIVRVEHGL